MGKGLKSTGKSILTKITVRNAEISDVPQMCAILNEIIEIGGTTAHQVPFDEEKFAGKFLLQDSKVSCLVAVNDANDCVGFQTVDIWDELPIGWGDISTFARVSGKIRGVGTALFAETSRIAEQKGLTAINAVIRADNTGGLAFYGKMGFETYKTIEAAPLLDGTPVDRIFKRHFLG